MNDRHVGNGEVTPAERSVGAGSSPAVEGSSPSVPAIDKPLVYVVDRDNAAAWSVAMKICQAQPRPGQFIPVTAEEFEALKSGVIAIQMP
jgi:hypothetical protein